MKTSGMRVRRAMARRTLQRFARDERGTVMLFALILFAAMLMIGGLAVDVMRHEAVRTRLQNTLDRSTLAAASLTQGLSAESVVTDYFAKADLSEYLTGVTVSQGFNFKQVTADAQAATDPMFLHMVGIQDFDALGHSQAEQRVTRVEIALVLDISGSMNSNSRLTNLKAAATEFVDTVLANDSENRISIAIVPFNGQVNLGTTLAAKYNLIDNPNVTNSTCVDLPSAAYSGSGLSTTLQMPYTAYADSFSSTNQTTSFVSASDTNYARINTANIWCPAYAANIVRLPSNTAATLKSQINALTAIGATSINAGMRWGTALLDPGSQTMFTQLIGAGAMSSNWAGRPYAYDADNSMKIVVLMTDGEHFAEERINASYRSGTSPIYKSTGDGNYSIRFTTGRPAAAGTNEYWVPHLCTSSSCMSGSNTSTAWRSTAWNSGSGVVQQTWPQVWASQRVSWVAWQLYARALGTSSGTRSSVYSTWIGNFRTQTATTAMDSQLQGVCTRAKQNGVIVYGIAFEAPTNGQTQIAACASSAAHYFNASGVQIKSAFRTIASNISQLRLTQ